MYPFITHIRANYLIASHIDIISYVFIIQATLDGEAKCDFTPRIEAKEKKTQKRAAPFTGTARFPDNEII